MNHYISSERKILQNRLIVQLNRLSLHAEIFEFESGEAFLVAARKKRFTLIFLDIYLEKENGVETTKKLRNFDEDCMLIFTTTSTDHALDGFRV